MEVDSKKERDLTTQAEQIEAQIRNAIEQKTLKEECQRWKRQMQQQQYDTQTLGRGANPVQIVGARIFRKIRP